VSAAEQLPRPGLSALSPDHQHEILVESSVSAEVAARRGYRTVTRRSELAAFPKWQRRLGLLVPMFSPDGVTTLQQIKPHKPRKPGLKYETPHGATPIIDVHPDLRTAIKDASIPLYVTEGIKTGDAATSLGRCVVVLAGVWGWLVPGVRPYQLLPCWDHVALKGRLVYVGFDSDAMTKQGVQDALAALVTALEARGARVRVLRIPDAPDGSKQGIDDYVAAGGELEELERAARPFEPIDVGPIRLSKSEELRAANEYLWAEWRGMPARKMADCTDRAVMRDLTEQVPKGGKLEDGGVLVVRSVREAAKGAQTSLGAVAKSIDRLEASGRLRRAFWGRAKDKPGAYLLFTPGGEGRALREQQGSNDASTEGGAREGEKVFSLASAGFDRGVHATRAPSDELPALRWPKVVLTWGVVEGRRVVVDSYYVARLGKRREEIMRHVLEAGGDSTVGELLERFGARTTRARDFRNRMLGPIVAEGIFTVTGEDVALTDGWRAALEEARKRTDELKDARLQAAKYERQQESYRMWLASEIRPDPTPELAGREEWRRIARIAAERDEAARIEEQRRKVGTTAETFVFDKLQELGRVRFGLLRDLWADRGGSPSHVMPAARKLRCKVERLPEYGNALFVFPPGKRNEASRVVPMRVTRPGHRRGGDGAGRVVSIRPAREEASAPAPSKVAVLTKAHAPPDTSSHSLSCVCEECTMPAPRYARPWGCA
jgi:hypothetical protein